MAEHTINVNIVDRSVPIGNHKNIAIINKPNPAMNVDVDARELYCLINNPNYFITDSETGDTINGVNYYEYFPEAASGGGSISNPILIEKNITKNGEYIANNDSADGYSSVTVNVSSGSSSSYPNDVNFIDYDGTIVYSYTAAEFAQLESMPSNPSHDGLTAQGWNWSFADAKTYVASYGKLNIGQMYITTDGKTHIHIVLEDGRLEPVLGLGVNGSVDIDWGDGSEHTTLTGTDTSVYVSTSPHTYITAGIYTIKLNVTGSMAFMSKNNVCGLLMKSGLNAEQSGCYRNAIKGINIGEGETSIGSDAFNSCYSLRSITIPSGVTSIGNYAFHICYSLSSITIPSGVTSIKNNAFYYCYSLRSITIPNGITSIDSYTFNNCYSLNNVTIPDSVTSIKNDAFNSCYSLRSITIPNGITSIGYNAFNRCCSISNIVIPESVTSIGNYTFNDCSISSITISSGVTSINSYTFNNCYSLSNVTIPDSVTSIKNNAFSYCKGLGKIIFTRETPPTVSNSNAFSNISTDCKIYIPEGSLSAYTSAQNYPSSRTYTYIEY